MCTPENAKIVKGEIMFSPTPHSATLRKWRIASFHAWRPCKECDVANSIHQLSLLRPSEGRRN
ncbi:hypothetical protein I7I53_11329 [Histoplasma capsulatum var. duboisii H88]|uniref:Uncharacterized protein n=1 Tax=Ajellomyces capsulatus (strain H88) TaxID=544711 RepID=A0A8A1LF11_AJEC8|nr:hypothetical protein I7I53_11329 [Histoplasma capsulatum var. duboisii H88]